jgi:hypothetical protein
VDLVGLLRERAHADGPGSLWIVSDGVSVDSTMIDLARVITVRAVRAIDGEIMWRQAGVSSAPLVLLVSLNGRITNASVGYYPGINSAFLGQPPR